MRIEEKVKIKKVFAGAGELWKGVKENSLEFKVSKSLNQTHKKSLTIEEVLKTTIIQERPKQRIT